MNLNPFKKESTIAQKVGARVGLPKLPGINRTKTTKEKIMHGLQIALIYAAFFIAGFVLSKVHTLMLVTG